MYQHMSAIAFNRNPLVLWSKKNTKKYCIHGVDKVIS